MKFLGLEAQIDKWLVEDMPYMDITTDLLDIGDKSTRAEVRAKAEGVIAGLEVFKAVFLRVNPSFEIRFHISEGDRVENKTLIAEVEGPANDMLKAERLALNLLQRMSGIATMSERFSSAVKPYNTKIVDTRKTTPGLRQLEKYAVRVGGAFNHRYSLSDAVMIKDNHIKASGGITKAVESIQSKLGHTTKIEVEVTNLKELREAFEAGADIVMLDNMTNDMMKKAVEEFGNKVVLEASGGVTLETVEGIAATGVHVVSVGALTHSYKSLDISMNIAL
ncbi:carboxylating nicotinate-nucleotide diphosphorylase [Fusibacter sp. JL216-2]|uniref:carboxylating nicotinate-nucleotide diphosphorylase n=1 Tax=Fusibacter sp. JL216-2 TaxID=3071453 RepID=UPI003D32C0A4